MFPKNSQTALTDGKVEIEFSADPTNATVVSFTITRAVVSVIHNQ